MLTGCDTVSSIYGVGKGKADKALQIGHVPPPLGNDQINIETIVSVATEFIEAFIEPCLRYGSITGSL